MKISISATNPCHMFPLARELHELGVLGAYYSGYPEWKLSSPPGMVVRACSLRTTIVYGLLKFAPAKLRPNSRSLFLWQDHGFDKSVGKHLEPCDFVHAMPGQCLHTFRAARRCGIQTVMNHATGPVREWVRIMEPEYRRVGLKLTDVCPYDDAYFEREDEEYALADWHCAASTVVRDQLIELGIPATRIWLVPYGAESELFQSSDNDIPPSTFRIVFAGQVGIRKGMKTLLDALTLCGESTWHMDFYGTKLSEAETDLSSYRGTVPLRFFGPVAQATLAEAFRTASVLVLPSLEEGFGLVVPQALACGTPAIVSDRVGAKDLIRHRDNGSIFTVEDPAALAEELRWWAEHPKRISDKPNWKDAAESLLTQSDAAL